MVSIPKIQYKYRTIEYKKSYKKEMVYDAFETQHNGYCILKKWSMLTIVSFICHHNNGMINASFQLSGFSISTKMVIVECYIQINQHYMNNNHLWM